MVLKLSDPPEGRLESGAVVPSLEAGTFVLVPSRALVKLSEPPASELESGAVVPSLEAGTLSEGGTATQLFCGGSLLV